MKKPLYYEKTSEETSNFVELYTSNVNHKLAM